MNFSSMILITTWKSSCPCSDGVDKREGSIIYDAIAPVAYSFAEMAMNMQQVVLNAYLQTANGVYLDYKAAERGTQREPATNARVTAEFTDNKGNPLTIDVEDRFQVQEPILFSIRVPKYCLMVKRN